jgi:hypothetical protein
MPTLFPFCHPPSVFHTGNKLESNERRMETWIVFWFLEFNVWYKFYESLLKLLLFEDLIHVFLQVKETLELKLIKSILHSAIMKIDEQMWSVSVPHMNTRRSVWQSCWQICRSPCSQAGPGILCICSATRCYGCRSHTFCHSCLSLSYVHFCFVYLKALHNLCHIVNILQN